MRVVIIPYENRVNVEGYSHTVDCSSLDEEISVVQWFGTNGWIEFHSDIQTGKGRGNEDITDFAPYQYLVDAWEVTARAT